MNAFDLGLSVDDIREQILDRAAQKLADDAAREEYIGDRVKRLIEERVNAAVQAQLVGKVDAILNTQLERLLDETIQPVDIFGDRTGEPTTIKAVLADRAKTFWDTKVDNSGKPITRDGYGIQTAKTRAEYMLGNIVSAEFIAQVKQNATNILGALKDKLREDARASVDKHLDELIRVSTR